MVNRIRRAMDEREQGFTLIELLVVIIIIGILAAIAIPVFLNQRKKGVDASLKSDLHNAATQVETWATDNPSKAVVAGEVDNPTAATPAVAGASLSGFNASSGNSVKLVPSAGTTGAYCLFAWNAGASNDTKATAAMEYQSLAGGLVAGSLTTGVDSTSATACA